MIAGKSRRLNIDCAATDVADDADFVGRQPTCDAADTVSGVFRGSSLAPAVSKSYRTYSLKQF